MNDNQLISKLIALINAGLVALGFTGANAIVVQQSNQPTQQGVPSGRTIYLTKVPGEVPIGQVGRTDKWVVPTPPAEPFMQHAERQWYEITFQFGALAIQNPTDVNSLTASDLLRIVRNLLQSDVAINTLFPQGIGILRIGKLSNLYFVDDKDRFEASPSFDFTLTCEQVILSTNGIVQSFEYNFYRV